MTAYTVRPATDDDRAGVAALFSAWERHELQASNFLDRGFHDGRLHVVALWRGTVVGYGNLTAEPASTSGPYLTEADGAHCIPDLTVRADHQSRGVGRLLVQHLGERARKLGASGIFVSVDGGGEVIRRIQFFESVGLRPVNNPGYPPKHWTIPYCIKMF